jgi:hypothetical protein
MPNSVWRTLLTLETAQQKVTSSSGPSKGNKLRETAIDFLQNCLSEEGVEFREASSGELQWNGKNAVNLSNLEREEIVWELAELNFRFELLALDSRSSTELDVDRQQMMLECFSGSSSMSLLVADLGTANHGLSSQLWEERAPYLQALKRLMMSWQGEIPPIIMAQKVRWSMRDIEDLESEITKFYVASFYRHFRRAPIVPRGLSHQAALYRPPPPPKVIVLNARPNIFYDVSVFSLI